MGQIKKNKNSRERERPETAIWPEDWNISSFFIFQGGFARVHELTDLTTGHIYAGKIIPKSRITKPHHKEKVKEKQLFPLLFWQVGVMKPPKAVSPPYV